MNNDIPRVSISPDGRWALLPRYEPARLDEWAHRYPLIADYLKRYSRSQLVDPLQYFSTPSSYVPRRMTAWRLDDGREQTVVDAPDAGAPGFSGRKSGEDAASTYKFSSSKPDPAKDLHIKDVDGWMKFHPITGVRWGVERRPPCVCRHSS